MSEVSQSDQPGFIIALDGPVASGKGTIAPRLAQALGGFYLPTGVMYRCVVLYSLRNASLTDRPKVIASLPEITIRIRNERVYLNEEDVTEEIKQNDISRKTSFVSGIPEVRAALIKQQREIGAEYVQKHMVVVAEGRDVGTVVFPDALLKIYLTASPEVRARRRLEQLQEQGERTITYDDVYQDTVARDTYDQDETKALVKNPEEQGYAIVDNSELSQDETVALILRLLKEKRKNI